MKDAKAAIAACWAISRAHRESGITAEMRSGAAQTIGCLQGSILEKADILFAGSPQAKPRLKADLDAISTAHQDLTWMVYNENVACAPGCGSIYHTAHLGAHAKLLEDIVRMIARVRELHRL